jgi:PKD repeat protein
MPRSRYGLFRWVFFALWLPALSFGRVVKMDLPQLIQASDVIVQGWVVETQSQWLPAADGRNIYTFAKIRGAVPLKGALEENPFTLKVMGGTVDGMTQDVSDTPGFSPGDEVFLFLRSSPLRVVGGFQGRWSVQEGKVMGVARDGVPVEVFTRALKTYLQDPSADLYTLLVYPPPSAAAAGPVSSEVAQLIQASKPADAGGQGRALTAKIVFLYWDKEVDYDGDGYNQYAELYWDADVVGSTGSLTVYEKVYWKLSSASVWTPLISTPEHTIIEKESADAQTLKLNGGTHDRYDFRIEIYQQGASAPDDTADPSGDSSLAAFQMETPEQDAAGSGPVLINIEPGEASAGTDTVVFLRGLGFGSVKGSGKVEFFYGRDYHDQTIQVPSGGIKLWSDTAIQCEVPVGTVNGYAASAGSGPVTVTTGDGLEAEYDPYRISFGYMGRKWEGTNPTVEYYVGATMPSDWIEAIQNADDTWSGDGFINFENVGTTDNDTLTGNNKSEIMYEDISDPNVLAWATCWASGSKYYSECDLSLNKNFPYSTLDPTPSGKYDVWTMVLHELGHWLALRDLHGNLDEDKVMYYASSSGQRGQNRHLSQADADGVAWIYGAPKPPKADFTWFTGYPKLGQPVAFMDESTLAPTAWAWNFGDGFTSAAQNPEHAYPFAGTFPVTLTATNAYGSGTAARSIIMAGSGAIVPPVSTPQAYTYVIPATAKAVGAGNTNWLSDMTVFNPGAADTAVFTYFLESGRNNATTPGVEIGVTGTKFVKIGDLVAHIYGRSNTSGALMLASAQPVQIASRTYNDQGEVKGTYGQFIPAFAADQALGAGEEGILLHLAKTARFRSNVGGVNLSNAWVTVDIAAYDANNTFLGTKSYTLQPYEHFQTNGFLDQLTSQSVQDAYAVAVSSTAGARYLVYASIVDNTTGDPIFIPPQKEADVQGQTHQLIATVARAKGGFGSNWKTDARFYNPFAAQSAVLTLVTGVGSFTGNLSLNAGQLASADDVISTLFPSVTGDTAGSLHIQSAQGLLITSRTYNDQGDTGTYGQFIPARSTTGVIPNGEAWQLLQLASNSAFRCNIGFSDFGGGGAQVQVKLYDSNRSILGFKTYSVPSNGNTQINDIFKDMNITTSQDASLADVRVLSGGPVYAYASVVDNRSNDAIFIPAQK